MISLSHRDQLTRCCLHDAGNGFTQFHEEQIVNCPKCGRLPYPRMRRCECGALLAWKPEPVAWPKPLPTEVERNLKQLGFEREAGETPAEFAARCRRWMLDRFSNRQDERLR